MKLKTSAKGGSASGEKNLKLKTEKGIIALPAVLLIGGIIAEIGVVGLVVSYFLIQSSFGIKSSIETSVAAQAGIQDALIKIIRDKDFTSAPYNLSAGNWLTEVTVCRDTCVGSGKYEITSLGKVKNKQSKFRAIIEVNAANSEVNVESLEEIAI